MHSANLKSSFLPDKLILPEVSLPSDLPVDLAALTLLMDAQRAAHQAAVNLLEGQFRNQLNRLIEQFILSRHRQFGVSSEQLSGQGRLFDEAELLAAGTTEAQDLAVIPAELTAADNAADNAKAKARGKRAPLPAELPRVVIFHDVPEADRFCACGTPMVLMGQQISEQLDIVPMQIRVLQHVRNTYGCPVSEHAPVTAPVPVQPLPKTNASADFLAMLLTVKYVDGLPLTRFNKVLNRHGAPVPVQTLARWVIGSAEKVLQPLFNVMYSGPRISDSELRW